MKKFEELNVIDDFMFKELMMQESEEKSEEFCRSILEPIIEKKIGRIKIEGQRVMQGVSPDARGIELDAYIKVYRDDNGEELADVELKSAPVIYNLEPNNKKTSSDEKRTRLYHSLIDSHIIRSGTSYSDIPDVMVIMILPYDPFDRNRMVYTVKKYCKEELNMPYEDGDTTLYLYAYGKKDIPSQRLADMLKFMVESTRENAEKAGLTNVQTMLENIKSNSRIGVRYVQSWEEKMYYEEKGRKEGRESGLKEGRESGLKEGRESGLKEGRESGLKEGRESGLKEGRESGLKEGHEIGVLAGKTESVLELLGEKGIIDENLKNKITAEKDRDKLNEWLRLAASCDSVEGFEKNM